MVKDPVKIEVESYYINNTSITTSESDFRFVFAERIYEVGDVLRCFIVMSPEQFKRVHKLMAVHLENFEEKVRKIEINYEPTLKTIEEETKEEDPVNE